MRGAIPAAAGFGRSASNLGAVDLALIRDELERLDEASATPAPYPAWMLSLGDDRRPGTARDLAALLKKKK